MGWTKHSRRVNGFSGCDMYFGFAWTQDPAGPTKSQPLKIFTTAGGQPLGVGIIIIGYGQAPLPDAQMKWATADPVVQASVDGGYGSVAHIDVFSALATSSALVRRRMSL